MSYAANQPGEQVSIYDQVGGEETFDKLTRRFYALVKADPEFSAMYPDFDPFRLSTSQRNRPPRLKRTILTISMHRRGG